MSGVLNTVIVLCCSVAESVADNFLTSPDIQISALGLGKVLVSWKHSALPLGNIMYQVKVKTPDMDEEIMEFSRENFYIFDWLAVHRGLSVQVEEVEVINNEIKGKAEPVQWASNLLPFPGDEGTEPLQLTCDMHFNQSDTYWLSCDWLPGEKAPLDTRYYFYFRHMYMTKECPNYVTEPGGGRRIGCRTLFSDTSINVTDFLVHINGSSHSRHIRATEHVFNIRDIEVIPPVRNLTLNMENRRLSWMKPLRSHADFCFNYQINIWSKDKNETITVNEVQQFWNEDLQEPTSKHHVRVRAIGKASCWIMERYSSWTEVIHIDSKNDDILWITFTACLFVTCVAVFLLCIRFRISLFPRIPKPKDELKDAFKNAQHQALIRCNYWDTEEVISYIEVMGCPDKPYKMPLDYGQVTD